jgi:transposase
MPSIGTSTIYTTIIPKQWRIEQLIKQNISQEAKRRLRVIDFYYHKASQNAALTCRHFLVSSSFLYKWLGRFNPRDLSSLESRSRKPHHTRSVCYTPELVSQIRKLRQEHPTYSAKKIKHILDRDFTHILRVSAATIGRIIKRFALFFAKNCKAAKRRSKLACIRKQKQRKPYGLKTISPHQLIEFDMKHIYLNGTTPQYAFCAIDPYTKESLIHIASTPSSGNARVAMEKVLAYFGKDIVIVNDNGSENMGKVYDLLQEQSVIQFFTRPYEPKDKPYIENFIGKYQQECLDESIGEPMSIAERQEEADRFLEDWHNYRPHQSLGYLTPSEFMQSDEKCARMNLAIPSMDCSSM